MTLVPVFDGHNDTLLRLHREDRNNGRSFFERSDQGHIDLPRAREAGMIGGLFAIFVPPPETSPESDPYYGFKVTENGYEVTLRSPVDQPYAQSLTDSVIESMLELEAISDSQLQLVRTAADLDRNHREGIFSIVLHLEGAAAIDVGLRGLKRYYDRGVRSLGIVWSRPNAFGCGVPFRFPHSPDTGPGLTLAGRQLVQTCNQLGVLIDLAHLNEQGFWDVAQISDSPLVVSHAGVHAICPSSRNLTDAQIDAVGQSNGLIGIIFEPTNIRPDGRMDLDTPVTMIIRHLDYVVERIGIDHVALGSDFDGASMPYQLADVSHLPRLIQALQESGYDRDAMEKIAYRNWIRVLSDSWRQ
jgi:membrane dipeptidase